MIKNLWGIINVYCGNEKHESPVLMNTGYKKGIMGYVCDDCKNFVSMNDFEKAVNKISQIIYDAEMNNEIVNLENEKWTTKGIIYKITSYSNTKIDIEIINKKELF